MDGYDGLDVGARHVRLVELEGGSRGLRVCRLGEREIALPEGGDREEAVRDAVDALFRETRAGRDETVLSWPAESCILRELSVPFREKDQIRQSGVHVFTMKEVDRLGIDPSACCMLNSRSTI